MATFGNLQTGATSVQAPPASDKSVSQFLVDFPGNLNNISFAYNAARGASRAVIYDSSGVGGLPGNYVGASLEAPANSIVTGLAVDGFAVGGGTSGTTTTITLTTSRANDIIVVDVNFANGTTTPPTVTGVAGTGLAFARRNQVNNVSTAAVTNRSERWWAVATSALSALVITVTFSGAITATAVIGYAVSGCNTSAPWDTNVNSSANNSYIASGNNTTIQCSGLSTNANNCALLFFYGINGSITQTGTVAGYTSIANTAHAATQASYVQSFSSITIAPQSSVGATYSGFTSPNWTAMLDALALSTVYPAPTVAQYTFSPTVALSGATMYWIGVWAATASTASCVPLTGGIAFNANTYSSSAAPSNPFGASPSQNNFQYPIVADYTPTLPNTTFGYLDNGNPATNGLPLTIPANAVSVWPTSGSGTINSLVLFLSQAFPLANARAVVYDATGAGGAPGNLLGSSNNVTSLTINANEFVFTSAIHVSGSFYIGIITDTPLTAYFATGSTSYVVNRTYTSGPPAAFGTPTSTTTQVPTIWVNVPSTLTNIESAQTVAEVLRQATNIPVNLAQLNVEILRQAVNPPLRLSQLTAEVLRASGISATNLNFGFVTRETLSYRTGILNIGFVSREVLETLPGVLSFGLLVREALEYGIATQARVQGLTRETLLPSTRSFVDALIRESLFGTVAVTQLLSSTIIREALIHPSPFLRIETLIRESLIPFTATQLLTYMLVRESLVVPPRTALMQLYSLVREVLYSGTLAQISTLAREMLRSGINDMLVELVCRETLFRDPVPVPPGNHRRAWVWLNQGTSSTRKLRST